jgi:hypothetical protein
MKNLLKKSRLKNFEDKRGKLFFFQKNNLKIKRVFFIQGNNGVLRGKHAHKNTKQILININSITEIEILNKKKKKIKFTKSGEFIEIPKMNWVNILFKNKGNIAVICDKTYSKYDYIYDFTEFEKKLSKSK